MTPDPKSYPRQSIMIKLEIMCNVKRDYSHWSYIPSNEIKRRRNLPKKSNVQLFKEFMAK
jgi:hypothetical protein